MQSSLPVDAVSVRIPPLRSGGVMLSWRCTSACRHCVYRSSPAMPDEWIAPAMMDRVIAALGRETELQGIHIGGGEPTLDPDTLEAFIRKCVAAGLTIDYLETNGYRYAEFDRWVELFERLKAAGLERVMVSCSPFHNETVPFRNTQECYAAAAHVFSDRSVFAYTGQMYNLLAQMGGTGTQPIERFLSGSGLADTPQELPRLYGVVPTGRAPEGLRFCYEAGPAEAFKGLACREELFDTTHFHLDGAGNLFTGLCAGIAAAAVDDLHPIVAPATHPAFITLFKAGPYGLHEVAREKYGFRTRPDGYVSKCDLCYDVRKTLVATGDFPDLRPEFYYRS